MSPFEILVEEHDHILRALTLLQEVAARLERGEPEARGQLQVLVEFFRRFADDCHHAKEEKVLFPALAEHGLPQQGGPIAVMLAEHVEGRQLVGRVADHLEDPERTSREDAAGAARAFVMLLREHIEKENEVLFAIGRNAIPESRDADLLSQYARFEAATMRPEEKERLLAGLDALGNDEVA